MSIPLHDLGSIKVSERDHSFLRAKALKKGIDVSALVRQVVHEYVESEVGVFSLAQEIHHTKGLGTITEDRE